MWPSQGSALRVAIPEEAAEPDFAPVLLVRLEPWHRSFFSNLSATFWPQRNPPLRLISWPGTFWPDVMVPTRTPWRALSESVVLHLAVIASVVWLVPLLPHREVIPQPTTFHKEDVIYYSASEYLPPLDTGHTAAPLQQKGDPAYAPQPIISVPPEADNRRQTIVTPPDIKLNHDVPLPNIVAWSPTPVAVPMQATARPVQDLKIPSLTPQVIAPAPNVNPSALRQAPSLQATVAAPTPDLNMGSQRQAMRAPEASVIAPAPNLASASIRKIGDINIGHSEVAAPAPSLPVSEQRIAGRSAPSMGGSGPAVAAPTPSTQGLGTARSGGGQIIALSVAPAPPSAAAAIPAGNRRGTFAATPEGKAGATATPAGQPNAKQPVSGIGGNGQGTGNGAGSGTNAQGAPPGLMVGASPNKTTSPVAGGPSQPSTTSDDSKLRASITPPRVTGGKPATEVSRDNANELEKKVFGNKKFYSMMLNLPNLNSSGGSWVIRFAELNATRELGDLNGPTATQTVDPAYPLELIRRNIQGTVTLYAVIHSDGTVGEIRVLDGVNDQLDEAAKSALSRWHFVPGSKNGSAVDLEAVVKIPFRANRFKSF
jgi:TonB family protein